MKAVETSLPGVLLFEPRVFHDDRGYFLETWSGTRYADLGLPVRFVQDNVSSSLRGVLRGLHYQNPHGQGKLVTVLAGEIFDVVVDIRVGSPTFGRWAGFTLSVDDHRQLYVPPGFAHGFAVTSERALVCYKCTKYYTPAAEKTLLWCDPDLCIDWPVREPLVSVKDRAGLRLRDTPPEHLPRLAPEP